MAKPILIIANKNYSSWSLRPWLALKQAGFDFEEVRIPLDTPQTREQILAYSPSGRVPVLLDGPLRIWESLAICEYANEVCPHARLWPEDQAARAMARSISCEMHSGFAALRSGLPVDIRARPERWSIGPAARGDISRVLEIWQQCRRHFGDGGKFLFGHFTIADAMFAPVVTRFVTYAVELDSGSRGYCEAILALEPMRQWQEAARAETESLTISVPAVS